MKCSFCERDQVARGMCLMHYKRWHKHGCALVVKRTPAGLGTAGYKLDSALGIPVHVAMAEKALGKKLPIGACVHHANGNRRDNRPENLVVCPDNAYHRLVHKRTDAYAACGHASWFKCPFCKLYDKPANLYVVGRNHHHQKCKAKYSRRYLTRT